MTRPRLIITGLLVLAILGAMAWIRHDGVKAGTTKVEQRVERQRTDRIVEARTDERTAGDVAASIDRRVARADDLTTAAVAATVKDLRDAIEAIPSGAAGAPPPAAPVERLRDTLNAGIDRANRSAAAAEALR